MSKPDLTLEHEPLCRATYKALTPALVCRDCDLLREQRLVLVRQLRTLSPICREPQVALSSGDCTCWAGITAAINIIERGTV